MRDRWVLKSPIHLKTLDALLDEYPDARVIFTHRDPANTVPSVASLMYTIGGIVTDSLSPEDVGRQQLDWWADAVRRMMDVRASHPDKAEQFVDIHFEDVVSDPVLALRGVYERFDLPWSDGVERGMRRFMAENPRGKHGAHRYELDDFGLALGEIRERFRDYCEAHDVRLVV
jgi:hypothetical protein